MTIRSIPWPMIHCENVETGGMKVIVAVMPWAPNTRDYVLCQQWEGTVFVRVTWSIRRMEGPAAGQDKVRGASSLRRGIF